MQCIRGLHILQCVRGGQGHQLVGNQGSLQADGKEVPSRCVSCELARRVHTEVSGGPECV